MAKLIPPQPSGNLPKGALRLHAALKTLPDTWTVWQNMQATDNPDFLVLHRRTARAFLLRSLRDSKAEIAAGSSCHSDVAALTSLGSDSLFGALITRIATHHDLEELPTGAHEHLKRQDVSFFGKSVLSTGALEAHLDRISKPAMMANWFDELRCRFAPEGLLDPAALLRSFEAREEASATRRTFLDLDQEALAKKDLELPPEQAALANDFTVRLLTGVAGAGKTLVLLHRAALLAKRFPKAKIQVSTFNKPLAAELERRLRQRNPDTHVKCSTFHSWCASIWKSQGHRPPIDAARKREVIRDLATRHLISSENLSEHLASELDWIHDQGFRDWDEYRIAERRGRGFRVSLAQRASVWNACVEWREFLDQGTHGDYPHFGFRFHSAIIAGLEPSIRFDAIMVDEAQFFAQTWFHIVRHHLKPTGTLFLCADPSQGFLRHGVSWNSAGLSVRGRTDKLNRSYRTTRSILEFAWSFLQTRQPELSEESVLPDLSRMEPGDPPVLLQEPDLSAQIHACIGEITEAIGKGFQPRDFLVLVTDPWATDQIGKGLFGHGVPAVKAELAGSSQEVRVCTLEKATGLEASIVYVLGASQLLDSEGNPLLDDEAREALRQRHARQLYMGFTRAGSMLRIGWSGPVPQELRTLLTAD